MASRGPIARAVIKRIAKHRRIPVAAAAHKYSCMSIERKAQLCRQHEQRLQRKKETEHADRYEEKLEANTGQNFGRGRIPGSSRTGLDGSNPGAD